MIGGAAGALSVAQRFLQTVVVVDDSAYLSEVAAVSGPASLGGEELHDGASSTTPVDEGVAWADDEVDLDALDPLIFETETIVEGFADLGMNCAVLAPSLNDGAQDELRLQGLAVRADVIILDWLIRPGEVSVAQPSNGDRTSLGLLLQVLHDDAVKGASRLRLICIYTGEADTSKILESITKALGMAFPGAGVCQRGFYVDIGPARVVVLSKEKTFAVPGTVPVAARDLPARVVQEFATFVATGMLPEIALESLAAIRDQSHRLLRRFSSDLDYALLSHRSLTSPAAAEQFVLSLIGSELATIAGSADVASILSDGRVVDAVESAFIDRSSAFFWKSLAASAKSTRMAAADAKKALIDGVDGDGWIADSTAKMDRRASRVSLLLPGEELEVRAAAEKIDLGFSALSGLARDCSFDGEGASVPVLQLGAILVSKSIDERQDAADGAESDRERGEDIDACVAEPGEAKERFWVCLQPLCDSIRLTNATNFPLLPLQLAPTESPKFEMVVYHGSSYIPLQVAAPKISHMSLMKFSPVPGRDVIDAVWANDAWEFKAGDGASYRWLGNLRLDKAHKLLHGVVATAGRIGIDEYEYLRLASG